MNVVFVDGFMWDIRYLDADIRGCVHGGAKIKVLYVKACKLRAVDRDDIADDKFDKFNNAVLMPMSPG